MKVEEDAAAGEKQVKAGVRRWKQVCEELRGQVRCRCEEWRRTGVAGIEADGYRCRRRK